MTDVLGIQNFKIYSDIPPICQINLASEEEYQKADSRYEELKNAFKGSDEHKEKMLIVHLISEYEKATSEFPEVDPIEIIKIRMEDFGFNSGDLAREKF